MPPDHRVRRTVRTVQRTQRPTVAQLVRPGPDRLTTIKGDVTRLDLPHGCFNAGIVEYYYGGYICVYRPDEHSFRAMLLDENYKPTSTPIDLGITNCADPRLIWTGDGLLMVYSSYDTGSFKTECIRGAIIMEKDKFVRPKPFRISEPSTARQKNWMPFMHNGKVHLVASVRPHTVYEMPAIGYVARMVAETEWDSPWFSTEFMRGNTNIVPLDENTMFGTFHTVQKHGRMHYYDNGCYTFENKPPFRVLRCATRTYLPAEAAVEPHFRKKDEIRVCFSVGMVRDGEQLLISYGDNDSAVKIMRTTVTEMLATTLEVY